MYLGVMARSRSLTFFIAISRIVWSARWSMVCIKGFLLRVPFTYLFLRSQKMNTLSDTPDFSSAPVCRNDCLRSVFYLSVLTDSCLIITLCSPVRYFLRVNIDLHSRWYSTFGTRLRFWVDSFMIGSKCRISAASQSVFQDSRSLALANWSCGEFFPPIMQGSSLGHFCGGPAVAMTTAHWG